MRLTILIAESILCPHAACSIGPMHGVDEAVLACQVSIRPLDGFVTQQTRRHTRPCSEKHKCKQVAGRECASSSLVETRACG